MNIAILGYGVEGKSARRFLKKKYPRARIEIRDRKFSADYLKELDAFDMIVRSPGIPYLTLEIQRAKKAGVEITSATKLFFSALDDLNKKWNYTSLPRPLSLRRRGGKKRDFFLSSGGEVKNFLNTAGKSGIIVIGITGTKGKGTVATMLYKILKDAGKSVFLVGNIGASALNVLPKLKKNSIVIFELSSFQLQDLDHSPHIAVVLEIAPDHLDHHKSMKEYVDAKANVVRYQTRRDTTVYIAENRSSKLIARMGRGKRIAASFSKNPQWTSEVHLRILGAHNVKNAIVAAAVARLFSCPAHIIIQALGRFKGLPYHLEKIRMLEGVAYYNDSASTNPLSTKAALEAIHGPKILIMGGADKGFDYTMLKHPIAQHNVCAVILFGANKNKIQRSLLGTSTPIFIAKNLPRAFALARKRAQNGGAVIFSPASASFDMFRNSKERGEVFTKLIRTAFDRVKMSLL